ncbi:glycosyltransferase [Flexivirga caeni]|nr:glycosyltransferase [Flexivirga caeni]
MGRHLSRNADMVQRGSERREKLRWSVVVPVHNCAHFLPETLAEVVEQLGGRDDAEIIVVDDASTDDVASVVRTVGRGTVRYERNPANLGAVATFNRCIEVSRGEIVHILHGDDTVLPGFYVAMELALEGSPALTAMCRTRHIDGEGRTLHETRRYREGTGIWEGAFDAFAVSNRVRAPGMVVRRAAYDAFGTFRTDLPHAADWELWTRMASRGPVVFVDEILAGYRKHGESDTSRRMTSGENIRERVTAIGLISGHVPPRRRRATTRKALAYSVVYAGRSALDMARRREWRAALAQTREGARCVLRAPFGVGCDPRTDAHSGDASVIRSRTGRSVRV